MKRNTLTSFVCMLLISSAFAMPVTGGDDEKQKSSQKDTASVETIFEMTQEMSNEELEVVLEGHFDEYASISITTTRGSELMFEFLEVGKNKYTFDLSQLSEGAYYLVLSANEEIRIKPFIR